MEISLREGPSLPSEPGDRGPEPSAAPPVTAPGVGAVRERFWNLPNTITVLRTTAVPVLLLLPILGHSRFASVVIAWVFIVAALTDLLDGWLARRGKQVTHIGKLLDPLADKLLVSTALIVLLVSPYPRIPGAEGLEIARIPAWATWMVVVIVGRELAVTGLRSIASAGGQVMAATWLGKAKALCQNVSIGALLFPADTLGMAHVVGMSLLFVATALTLGSGYLYFRDYFGSLAEPPGGQGR
jgi:CDP-diacylglycerol---glycerol-3-phosphate 3-phosphatidyltransferase